MKVSVLFHNEHFYFQDHRSRDITVLGNCLIRFVLNDGFCGKTNKN